MEQTSVREHRVEMYCDEQCLPAAIEALLQNHPYQMPQFDIQAIENNITVKNPATNGLT